MQSCDTHCLFSDLKATDKRDLNRTDIDKPSCCDFRESVVGILVEKKSVNDSLSRHWLYIIFQVNVPWRWCSEFVKSCLLCSNVPFKLMNV